MHYKRQPEFGMILETNSISASHLENTITETHFAERNRFGANNWADVEGNLF